MVDRQHPLGSGQVPEREAGARLGGGSFETDRELEINSQLQVDIEEFRAVLQGTKVGTQVAYVEPPQDRPLQLRSALQAGFVNIGMVSGLLPVVGVPLPFISYGGTSLVTLLLGFGILMSIQTHRKWMAQS